MYSITRNIRKITPICKNGLKSSSFINSSRVTIPNRTYSNQTSTNIASSTFSKTPLGVMSEELFLQPINPATCSPITDLKIDTKISLKAKFDAAYLFKEEWRNVELSEKKLMIQRFRDNLIQNTDSIAATLTKETGKPITQATNEVIAVIERINFFLANIDSVLKEQVVRTTEKFQEKIVREPVGVIAAISAWNYPIFIGLNVIIPALLAGNCVLYKPSEFSSLTGISIMNCLYEAGVPQEAFQIVLGKKIISQSLLNLPIDGVYFTGSYATGKSISENLAGRMIKQQLELGGKDAVYVHESADLKTAVASIADGAMYNTGQSCCSVERIYVDKSIYDTFVNELVQVVKSFKFSFDPTNPQTYFGPLTRGVPQIEHLQRLIGSALKRGAILELGGNVLSKAPGYFFAPTIVSNVHHGMEIQREELFGPVVTVQPVSGPTEAALLMNDTPYGLTGSVYSEDAGVANFIAEKSNTGTVYWNACDRVSPYLPWSGRGASGIGATLGIEGIENFTRIKALHLIAPAKDYFGNPSNSQIVTKVTNLVNLEDQMESLKIAQKGANFYEAADGSLKKYTLNDVKPISSYATQGNAFPFVNESLFESEEKAEENEVRDLLKSGKVRKVNKEDPYVPISSIKKD
ncbi:hypothetical protein DICPUDRAFT_47524 [Dictyostelium purpureum]|uniref:Aldehyde dehydrogenase domain-containing protein n=1 Tax=Dictyostelium purpureum TaxID=5786 RepID=F0ZJW9_DICPU|nr:uncharacterized protein DICPUDRAFT_47524 [Dictyostelium purpureum]EGC35756.1 hypothetical protein DICPUDRAFT_47524 [Dictyostelium purpureum]|eukprot:XP_003287708.1 hypothetical protein DICPUDRAFT_47524 [Dictyostelium purpureum]